MPEHHDVALGEIGPAAKAAVPRLKKMADEETNDEVAAAVPDEWLEQAPGLDTPEAGRAAYVEHLLARVGNAGAWLPGGTR